MSATLTLVRMVESVKMSYLAMNAAVPLVMKEYNVESVSFHSISSIIASSFDWFWIQTTISQPPLNWGITVFDVAHYFIDTNECLSEPCLHKGNCVDLINAYECNCAPGFVGDICQTGKGGTTSGFWNSCPSVCMLVLVMRMKTYSICWCN